VDFGRRVTAPDVAKMIQAGKMPLPDAWPKASCADRSPVISGFILKQGYLPNIT